jgi:hypothetical protein
MAVNEEELKPLDLENTRADQEQEDLKQAAQTDKVVRGVNGSLVPAARKLRPLAGIIIIVIVVLAALYMRQGMANRNKRLQGRLKPQKSVSVPQRRWKKVSSLTRHGADSIPARCTYPRLILVWMTTEALRTGERRLELGRSLSSFMGQLGLQCTGGHWGTIPRFRGQMERLFGAAISTRWRRDHDGQSHAGGSNLLLAEEFDLWWTPQTLPEPGLGQSSVTLSQRFFEQLVEAPVPLDLRAIKALRGRHYRSIYMRGPPDALAI